MSPSRMCSTAPVVTSATSAALTGVQAIPTARQAAAVLLVQECMSSSLIAATRESRARAWSRDAGLAMGRKPPGEPCGKHRRADKLAYTRVRAQKQIRKAAHVQIG